MYQAALPVLAELLPALGAELAYTEGVGLLGWGIDESLAKTDPNRNSLLREIGGGMADMSLIHNIKEKGPAVGFADWLWFNTPYGMLSDSSVDAWKVTAGVGGKENGAPIKAVSEARPEPQRVVSEARPEPQMVVRQPRQPWQPQQHPQGLGFGAGDVPAEALGVAGSYGIQDALRQAIAAYPQLWAEAQKVQALRDAESAARLNQLRDQYMQRILNYLPLTGNYDYPVW